MVKKNLIFIILITICSIQATQATQATQGDQGAQAKQGLQGLQGLQVTKADTACQMVDNVLSTFALIKDIQNDQKTEYIFENMSKLAVLVEQISVSALMPPDVRADLLVEYEVLYKYISNIRAAVSIAKTSAKYGYYDPAKQMISGDITRGLPLSIQSLDYYWHCRPKEPVQFTQIDAGRGKPVYFGYSATKANNRQFGQPNTRLVTHAVHSKNADKRRSKRVKFVLPAPRTNASWLLSLGVFIILTGIIFYFERRARRFAVREARRFLQMPSKIRIRKAEYSVIIVDISLNGAKIKHAGLFKRQRNIHIELDGIWYRGQIKWNNKIFAGLKFERPLNSIAFNNLVQSSTGIVRSSVNSKGSTSKV